MPPIDIEGGTSGGARQRAQLRSRRHGCQPPLNFEQAAAVGLWAALVAAGYAAVLPMAGLRSRADAAAATAAFTAVVAAVAALHILTR
jgi:hypothetical protein